MLTVCLFSGLSIFDSVERFDPISSTWILMPPMQTKRCRLGVAALKGKIYVVGGYDGNSFLQTAEVWDGTEWKYIASMNVARSRVSLIANGGLLYAIGKYDFTYIHRSTVFRVSYQHFLRWVRRGIKFKFHGSV